MDSQAVCLCVCVCWLKTTTEKTFASLKTGGLQVGETQQLSFSRHAAGGVW